MSQTIATLELDEEATINDIETLIDICIEGKTNKQFFEAVSNGDGTYDINRLDDGSTNNTGAING